MTNRKISMLFTVLAIALFLISGCAMTITADSPKTVISSEQAKAAKPSPQTWQNPKETSNSINSICFVDGKVGWAVGERHTVLRTLDGKTWEARFIGYGYDDGLKKVMPIDRENAWSLGNNGSLSLTTDGGTTWLPVNTPWRRSGDSNGTDAIALSKDKLLVLVTQGNHVNLYQTDDAGRSWTSRLIPFTCGYKLEVRRDGTIWLMSSGVAMASRDGGATWFKYEVPYTSMIDYDDEIATIGTKDIWIGGAAHGWIPGIKATIIENKSKTGRIIATSNAGSSWRMHSLLGSGRVFEIQPISSKVVWAAGFYGIRVTRDGGESWATSFDINEESENAPCITDLEVLNQKTAYLSVQNKGIFQTRDGGKTWKNQFSSVTDKDLTAACAVNDSVVWAVGDSGTIIKTTDGGGNWSFLLSGVTTDLTAVAAIDDRTAFVVGKGSTDDLTGNPCILKTSDGGLSWEQQYSGLHLDSITAVDAETAWAGGLDFNYVLYTRDGGHNWARQVLPSEGDSIIAISATSGHVLWAVTPHRAYRSLTGGLTWRQVYARDSGEREGNYYFKSVSAVDRYTAWITSVSGLSKTTDGGDSWSDLTDRLPNNADWDQHGSDWVLALDQPNIIAGDSTGVSESKDAGETWRAIPAGTNNCRGMAASGRYVWMVGADGMIIRTSR